MADKPEVSKFESFKVRLLQSVKKILDSDSNKPRIHALRITLVYFVIGFLWIFWSDRLVDVIFANRSSAVLVSMIKGWFYVLATSVLIYGLIYPEFKKNKIANDKLLASNAELEQSNNQYRHLNQEFDERQALLKSLIDSIPDLVFYKNPDSVYLGCNKAFEVLTGKPENEIIGLMDSDLFDPDKAEFFRGMDVEMLKGQKTTSNEEIVTYPDGREIFLETVKTPYFDLNGRTIGLIGISRDITERKKREDEIRYLNYHDALTGIYNRSYFQTELARLDTKRQLPMSVIVGDINGLKLINDALGHAEGDKLLVKMAQILKNSCRTEDLVARTGGDEFWILLPKTDGEGAQRIIERIKKACAELAEHPGEESYYTDIALGYATKTSPDESFAKIQKIAEDYMYKRKLLESKSLHSSIISSIKTTMFEKSNETEAHAERLTQMSKRLGHVLGLSEDELVALELLSTLHDIGKISVDRDILTKVAPLNEDEWNEIKTHPEVGYRITQASPELRHISEYILNHHERWDGKGYPQGLAGEEIPLLSRILSVVDAYDAMTQDRGYRKAMPVQDAVAEIEKNSGTQFDPRIARYFIELVMNSETGRFADNQFDG